jgi:hypothetical protein
MENPHYSLMRNGGSARLGAGFAERRRCALEHPPAGEPNAVTPAATHTVADKAAPDEIEPTGSAHHDRSIEPVTDDDNERVVAAIDRIPRSTPRRAFIQAGL